MRREDSQMSRVPLGRGCAQTFRTPFLSLRNASLNSASH